MSTEPTDATVLPHPTARRTPTAPASPTAPTWRCGSFRRGTLVPWVPCRHVNDADATRCRACNNIRPGVEPGDAGLAGEPRTVELVRTARAAS